MYKCKEHENKYRATCHFSSILDIDCFSHFLSPTSPPIQATCTTFLDVEIHALKVSLGLRIIYMYYVIYYRVSQKNVLIEQNHNQN